MQLLESQHTTSPCRINTLRPRSWGLLWLAFVLITGLVQLVVLLMFNRPNLFIASYPDETNYYLPAAELIKQNGLAYFKLSRSLWNGPLNPWWVFLWKSSIPAIKLANIGLVSVASALLALAVVRRTGSANRGWLALLLLSTFPPILTFTPTVLTEPLFLSLLMLSLSCCTAFSSYKGFILGGLFLGLACLARPTTQLLPLALGLVALVTRHRHTRKQVIYYAASALLTISPLLLWNALYHHKNGIANGLGAVLFIGNDFPLEGDEPVYHGVDFNTFSYTQPYTHLDTKGDKILTGLAAHRIKSHPVDFLWLSARKLLRFYFGSAKGYVYPFASLKEAAFSASSLLDLIRRLTWPLLQVVVVVLGSVGLVNRLFDPKKELLSLQIVGLVTILYFGLLHSVTFPIPRLFMPVYPFFLVFLCLGVNHTLLPKLRWGGFITITATLAYLWLPAGADRLGNTTDHMLTLFDKKIPAHVTGEKDINPETGEILSTDAWFVLEPQATEASRTQLVGVDLDLTCPNTRTGNIQLFWTNEISRVFNEPASTSIAISSAAEAVLLRPAFLSTWTGVIKSLRIDMPAQFHGCRGKIISAAIYR